MVGGWKLLRQSRLERVNDASGVYMLVAKRCC